jgi:hypothetical protein
MTPRTVVALGFGQCVNWGALYYAFAVLVRPLERELGVATWVVTGAFSMALLASAGAAPVVGRWLDRGCGARVMEAGAFAAAAVLVAWTLVPGVAALYAAWTALGACMAATLYEPAFAIVGRGSRDAHARLRALATLTLVGGLASTIFLPLTAFLVEAAGWRATVLWLAAALVLSTIAMRRLVFAHVAGPVAPSISPDARTATGEGEGPQALMFVTATFALASLAAAAFAANLVPALGERGISPAGAAWLGGLMGLMQLPGRALLLRGAFAASPARLLAASLLLQAAGLATVAAAASFGAAGAGLFALGGGLLTLVRPHLVQTLFGTAAAGHLNGRIVRAQHLARAAGPLAVAWLGARFGYAAVFAAVGVTFAAVALASHVRLESVHPFTPQKEAV